MTVEQSRPCAGCTANPDCDKRVSKPARGPWPERCPDCKYEHDLELDREYQRAKHRCPDNGYCRVCDKHNLEPRPAGTAGLSGGTRKNLTARVRGLLWGDPRAGNRRLVTRLLGQRPKHLPTSSERPDGTQLSAVPKQGRKHAVEWLNRVAPDPDYVKRPKFERTSDWQPASRSGIVGGGGERPDEASSEPVLPRRA
jgi:hypothetical protein